LQVIFSPFVARELLAMFARVILSLRCDRSRELECGRAGSVSRTLVKFARAIDRRFLEDKFAGIHRPEWLHELKYDRLPVERNGNRVRLITRGDYDWTKRFR
jgi:ATP-dependent DNA ligase